MRGVGALWIEGLSARWLGTEQDKHAGGNIAICHRARQRDPEYQRMVTCRNLSYHRGHQMQQQNHTAQPDDFCHGGHSTDGLLSLCPFTAFEPVLSTVRSKRRAAPVVKQAASSAPHCAR